MQSVHAQVRTVKISLTFIACQNVANFPDDTLSCSTCSAVNTCTLCKAGFVMYDTNTCISDGSSPGEAIAD